MTLVGSECAPCTTAFDSASVSASSILSSRPSAHFVSRTTFITLCTTGSTAFRSAQSVTLSLRINFCASNLQACCGESDVEEESDIGGFGGSLPGPRSDGYRLMGMHKAGVQFEAFRDRDANILRPLVFIFRIEL